MPVLAYADNRRRHGRLLCEGLHCPLGDVEDLSASGMRVRRKGRVAGKTGDRFPVRLISENGDALDVHVQIIRVEKIGFRRYSYGLQFVEVDDAIHARLTELIRNTADTKLFA